MSRVLGRITDSNTLLKIEASVIRTLGLMNFVREVSKPLLNGPATAQLYNKSRGARRER